MDNRQFSNDTESNKDNCLEESYSPGEKREAARLLKRLSEAFGPSGREDDIVQIIESECESFCRIETDSMQNVYLIPDLKRNTRLNQQQNRPEQTISLRDLKEQEFEWVIDAHMDEVGFIVKSIHENGTISMLPVGGWDMKNATGACFEIRTDQDESIPVIAVSRPVHFNPDTKEQKLLIVDAGCTSKQEVEDLGIQCGDFAVPQTGFEYFSSRNLFKGKAFDDRIGLAAEIMLLRDVARTRMASQVLGLASAQEEVGERGALCAVKKIRARYAICFEGCPADDTFENPEEISTRLNAGPMVRVIDRSNIADHRMIRRLRTICKEQNIPLQIAARVGGGTNAAVFAEEDIIPIVIGIPVRYAHSISGFASLNDLLNAVRLAKSLMESMNESMDRIWK